MADSAVRDTHPPSSKKFNFRHDGDILLGRLFGAPPR